MSDVADGMLVPSSCHATGVKYGDQCQLFCNNGFSLQGRKAITCQKNGNYDHDFKKSKCIPSKSYIYNYTSVKDILL